MCENEKPTYVVDMMTTPKLNSSVRVLVQAGIPFSEDTVMTSVEIQSFFAEYIPSHAPSLKKMFIHCDYRTLHLPVFSSLHLEELTRVCVCNGAVDIQAVSRAIGQLPKLKKLEISGGMIKDPFQIHSTSLEEIDTRGFMMDNVVIEKCVCTSLKV